MLKRFSFWLPLGAAIVCFIHYIGSDFDNIFFLTISIPAWFIEPFVHMNLIHLLILYALTILFWFAFGVFVDRTLAQRVGKKTK